NVTRKLQAASLEKNDPLIPHFYYVLAELHYKSKNYIQAHTFYTKSNITYLKEKKVTANAFLAYIVATSTFDKNSLIYLTSLIGNIGNQLKKMDTIDQTISYHIALLTQTVIEHNPMMNIEEKKALLLNGLQHLTYAQKNTNLTVQFHTLLATIYEEQNDIAISLKHTKNGLKNNEIAAILTHAEKVNPELYNRCASWTKIVLDYIEGRQQTNKQKNHILLPQFVASDLCAQLLSYCEQTPTTKKIFNNDMCSLLALNNKNKKNYALARHYIDKLIDPISADALFLKASIYATTHKTLSDTEFETVIKQYINNKKPSLDAYQTIISLLKRHHPFFMQKNNYKFAGKLISKISEQHNSTAEIIRLAYEIGSWLYTTQNEYLQQWYKELDACQFYNKIQDPSYYDSDTNALIGVLFMKQTSFSSYKKIISYFTTALESTNLSPENSQQLRNTCRILYFKWAQSMYHDGKEALHLFDLAIQYDPTDDSQYEKAYFILHNSDNKDLILYALELLEDIFQKNGRSKELAQQELALAYLNYSSNPVQIDTIRQCIPLDIDKALTYLQAHNNNKELLECIINILSGVCNYIEPIFTEKYKNLEEALTYTNIAIETNPDNIDYIAHRMILHRDLHNPTKAIEDIDLLLNHDLTNTDISQQHLLWAKAILLFDTSDEAKYDKALECIRQLQSWNKNKITVIDLSPKMLVYINTLIANQNMSDDAVEWCCLAADMEIIKENVASQNPTTEQK
ncbi:MAG TPA: hypothetical protein VHX42_03375, partial [Candidatus Babeliales bacterium]|nr:hypothetical protein [Candidatus Babeliales bacterium]